MKGYTITKIDFILLDSSLLSLFPQFLLKLKLKFQKSKIKIIMYEFETTHPTTPKKIRLPEQYTVQYSIIYFSSSIYLLAEA